MKKIIYVVVILAAIGLSAGAYYAYRKGGPEPVVSKVEVTLGDIVEVVGATGTLEALTTVQVGTQVSGSVLELNADFNSIVKKGQVIARLDPSLIDTQIEQNRANVIRAEADLERLKVQVEDSKNKLVRAGELSAKSLIPKTELETAEVAVKNAEASLRSSQASVNQALATLNQSQVNRQHTVIEAPIDGIVISRNVDVGQTVAASMNAPVLYLLAADLTKMKVSASIDESDVGKIRPGQQVRFRVDAYMGEEFTGTVWQVRLNPVVAQNVVTYATVIEVPNPQLKLKPGMTANVTIEIARKENAIRVPNTALRFRATADMFTALNLPVPQELQPRTAGGRGGREGGGRDGATSGGGGREGAAAGGDAKAAEPAAKDQPAAAPAKTEAKGAPVAEQKAAREGGGQGESAGRGGGGRTGGDSAPRGNREFGGGFGGGGRGGGSGGQQMDPEARRKMMEERMASMSPEEREQFQQRMRDRAQGGGRGGGGRGGGDGAGAPQRSERGASGGIAASVPTMSTNAQTIDALFKPMPPTINPGRVWVWAANELKSVRIRTGITDQQYSELVSGDLTPGMELVTGITTGREQQPATRGGQQGGNPMMPGGNRGFGGGPGGPGGGGGGGRGR